MAGLLYRNLKVKKLLGIPEERVSVLIIQDGSWNTRATALIRDKVSKSNGHRALANGQTFLSHKEGSHGISTYLLLANITHMLLAL
jgi:hypothetical protein